MTTTVVVGMKVAKEAGLSFFGIDEVKRRIEGREEGDSD